MDETQRRKISAKEFIEKNKKVGLLVLGVFSLLFIVYFIFIYIYAKKTANPATTTDNTSSNLLDQLLLPVFSEKDQNTGDNNDSFLNNLGNGGKILQNLGGGENNDNSKVVRVEDKPILSYVIFDKPVSIKNYIKNKPRICDQKIEPVLKKEDKSPAVLVLQNTLRSMDDYADTPQTGILDQATRDKLYVFQTRYEDVLYKNKTNNGPTRLVDKETAHLINLLCNFDTEKPDDYIQIPTVRYVLAENREIYDYSTDNKQKVQIDAKTATGTQDALFSKNGDFVVFRKDLNGVIDSIFYNIRTKSVTHLESNITTLDFNNNLLVYGIPGEYGMTIKSYDYTTNISKKIADIPMNEWNLNVISQNEIGLSNKPSAYAESIYMILDVRTKKLRQVAGPFLGLAVQKTDSPDLTILSTGGLGKINTLLLNNKTRVVGDFGIKTFAEKCSSAIYADGVFCAVPTDLSENYIYPDDWYKGRFHTKDVIVYKALAGTTTKVISYLENRPLSLINLTVNKNGIFFIDENTFSLYSIELNN